MKLLSELNIFSDTTLDRDAMYLTWMYGKDSFGTLWSISTVFEDHVYYVRRLRYLMICNKTQKINIYYKSERPMIDFVVNSTPLGSSSIPSSSELFIRKSDEYQIYEAKKPMKVNLQLKQWMFLILGKDSLDLHDIESMMVLK